MDELRLILLIIGVIIIIGIYGSGRRHEKQNEANSVRLPGADSTHGQIPTESNHKKEPFLNLSKDDHTAYTQAQDQRSKSLQSKSDWPEQKETSQSFTAYNTDIERAIEPVSIENWRFRPIDSGLPISEQSSDPDRIVQQNTTPPVDDSVDQTPSVKDPEEHHRFSHLEDSLLLVINVLADNGNTFYGPQLQQIFAEIGLEFGDMRIFHYYPDNSQQRLFSVANIKEPGCFELDRAEGFSTKGISLFMLLPGPLDGKLAFEILFGVAADLANKLGGYLCDEDFNKLTKQAIAHLKDKISEFSLHQQKFQH